MLLDAMSFIHEDFLLTNKASQRLYHEYAENEPILDYHCHLPPREIAENRRFQNLFEIWLEGDHYKWRAMRANGIAEEYCTGIKDPKEKFLAWARTVPQTLRNPLYHWTHLELKRYFGIDELLEEYCTGIKDPKEKFLAWARTVPQTLRNPLYHWTHLELKRYFGIDELLDESSGE